MQAASKVGGFAKRRTTGPCRNGDHCLNAATVPIAVLRRAATPTSTLRRMGRAYRCAPPILQIGHALRLFESVKTRVDQQTQNARLMPSSMLFRTQSRHRTVFVSRSTCRVVPAREQDETLVQQPSSYLAEGESLGSVSLRVEI